ncbi:DUF3883 domain-containing protein [Marinobacter mangrovi]|uniref:DUF3883 domain-containing protein n=1 Tax=Marinobacter mangrovi TaxID=2803918 RepID=UPI0019318BFC|nr:DUF3883 domain-containing protein [Marinobacter mangrovi]
MSDGQEPIVFINIGWMKFYQGETEDDPLIAKNFGYFKNHEEGQAPPGHEPWNFLNVDGEVIGYIPKSPGVEINNLGAKPSQTEIDGVLVVFVAKDPTDGNLKVVGWYKNATVNRGPCFKRTFDGLLVDSAIKANAADAFVVPTSRRREIVPTAKRGKNIEKRGGVGQSSIWYAHDRPDVIKSVRKFIAGFEAKTTQTKSRGRKGSPRNPDPETRKAVENFAMNLAMKYFEHTVDVSSECKGWDIEAMEGAQTLFVEVKGLSGKEVNFQLTPNEYSMMQDHRDKYCLFVVTGALTKSPVVRIFRYEHHVRSWRWQTATGEPLKLKEMTGAVGTC